jgi:hypothetical protein
VGRTGGGGGCDTGKVRTPRLSTAAHHLDDLDRVAVAERHSRECVPLDDDAVVLDRDRAGTDAQSLYVSEEWGRRIQLDLLAVDLQRDHWKSRIAA